MTQISDIMANMSMGIILILHRVKHLFILVNKVNRSNDLYKETRKAT